VSLDGWYGNGDGMVGGALSDRFPDALAGGSHIGALGGPILLTPTDTLESASTAAYVCPGAGPW